MTETDIQKGLRSLFVNNDYHLFNQYVFDHKGESDYFSITKSSLLIECEIKISRSDYFADFKKTRHKYLTAIWEKKRFMVENKGLDNWSGDVICKFRSGKMRFEERRAWIKQCNHWMYTAVIHQWIEEVRAPVTRIKIHDLQKKLLPNRFYYATPEGLIKPEELPPYAGLIELPEGGYANYKKKAPVLHKYDTPSGFWKTILDKYYFKHRELITKP